MLLRVFLNLHGAIRAQHSSCSNAIFSERMTQYWHCRSSTRDRGIPRFPPQAFHGAILTLFDEHLKHPHVNDGTYECEKHETSLKIHTLALT